VGGIAPNISVSPRLLAHPTVAVTTDADHAEDSALSASNRRLLVERLHRGDRAALEQIVADHCDTVARLVFRLAGWSDDADDLVQEVFLAALNGAARFDGRSEVATWLYRIAVNVCRAHRRKQTVRGWLWKKWMREPPPSVAPASDEPESREMAEQVTRSVRQLPGKYREVIVLRYLEGMEIDDVAKTLGLSRSAVEVRLHRAREQLRTTLGPLMET
jgi:RNA polymerase sigma-70 factor, ECF subfamily